MKIATLVRTKNEERNIERFCFSYSFADAVLVADGGSTDNTIEIANSFRNVKVKHYKEKLIRNGLWRNPHGKHINFLLDWAEEEKADWVIFDDCDCVPNFYWRERVRESLELLNDWHKNFAYVTRLYIYGRDKHFEKMAKHAGVWMQGLYAWRIGSIRADESDPWIHKFDRLPDEGEIERFLPPNFLLHYFAPSSEIEKEKRDFYINIGQHPALVPHQETYGTPIALPEYAKL